MANHIKVIWRSGKRTDFKITMTEEIQKEILDIYRAIKGIQKKLLTLLVNSDKDKNNEQQETDRITR